MTISRMARPRAATNPIIPRPTAMERPSVASVFNLKRHPSMWNISDSSSEKKPTRPSVGTRSMSARFRNGDHAPPPTPASTPTESRCPSPTSARKNHKKALQRFQSRFSPVRMAPSISSPLSDAGASRSIRVPMSRETSAQRHVFKAHMPGYDPDAIQIYTRKSNQLVIVADKWDKEGDCQIDWLLSFDKADVNMSTIRAAYHKPTGDLSISVERLRFFPDL